jgi:hypothetical protein
MKDDELLGKPYANCVHKLRKMLLFAVIQRLGQDVCYRCGCKILLLDELSIDHKKPWRGVSADLFWDLENIAFSHLRCNKTDRPFRRMKGERNVRKTKTFPSKQRVKEFCIDCGARRLETDFAPFRNVCVSCQRDRINRRYAKRVAAGYSRPRRKPLLGRPLRGTEKTDAKLDESKVVEIKRLRKQERLSTRQLASLFGVSSPLIVGILNGKRWKHVG